jgi:hypothetical protein
MYQPDDTQFQDLSDVALYLNGWAASSTHFDQE